MAEPTIPVHVTQHFGAEITRLRAENARLRTALEEIKLYTSALSPVGMVVRDVLASLDGEKEGSAEDIDTRSPCAAGKCDHADLMECLGAESTEEER